LEKFGAPGPELPDAGAPRQRRSKPTTVASKTEEDHK
jgi:hypothetical protein